LDRSDKWLAQTPQMFLHHSLMVARWRWLASVTDESSAIEMLGLAPPAGAAARRTCSDVPGRLRTG
jgi:2-C-methyl-D-erythritol 4-phosphate cytidylyltransferase